MLSQKEIVLRLAISLFVGLIIGYERSFHQKPAGIRTYSLVCIGSTLFMLVSAYGFQGIAKVGGFSMDPSRISAQIITGIGFLGAGVIWKDRGTVKGLTTAANLWVTAGLGMTVGLGLYFMTLVSVVCVFIALYSSQFMCHLGLLHYPQQQQEVEQGRAEHSVE